MITASTTTAKPQAATPLRTAVVLISVAVMMAHVSFASHVRALVHLTHAVPVHLLSTNYYTSSSSHRSVVIISSSPTPSSVYKFRSQIGVGPTQKPKMPTDREVEAHPVETLRSEFLHLLRSRRSAEVPLTVEMGKPVADPMYQDSPKPTFSEAMNACPREDIPNLKDVLKQEHLYLTTEAGEQGRLPVLILSLKESNIRKRPAVVILHSTHKCKEWLRPLLEAYASRGYIAVAIDSRYHGERATSLTTYRDALVSAWEKGDTMPFIFDTVWDLIKLADYLTQREDIDPSKIGITGESLGGMHAWFGAFVDTRYSVVVPIIGVQGFGWAVEHDRWHARVDSIKRVFEVASKDLGKEAIDKEVVEKVWKRIAPGLDSDFDSPHTVPLIAPRPLLILNGEEDPRCPIEGLQLAISRTRKAYEDANSPDKFELIAQPGIGHQMTPLMVKQASDWFDKFLK